MHDRSRSELSHGASSTNYAPALKLMRCLRAGLRRGLPGDAEVARRRTAGGAEHGHTLTANNIASPATAGERMPAVAPAEPPAPHSAALSSGAARAESKLDTLLASAGGPPALPGRQ
jgi:hypothetical protein